MEARQSSRGRPSKAQRKKRVRALLRARDLDGLLEWAGAEPTAASTLTSILFDPDEEIRWRTVEALGRVAALQFAAEPERVRDLIRRLFWSMNDESGNLIWNAPEAIGEILANVPELIDEYAAILCSFLCEEPFERGTHWAVARLARIRPQALADAVDELTASLTLDDAFIRGHAVLALAALGACPDSDRIDRLLGDETPVRLYDPQAGALADTSVARMAREAIGAD